MVRSLGILIALLWLLPAWTETRPYPNTLIALPIGSGVTVRWACPPVDATSIYDLQMGIDATGAPWLGVNHNGWLQCPSRQQLFETSRRYIDIALQDNGAFLMSTDTDWGYLTPAKSTTAKRPPTFTYQPVAVLPVPRARMFTGEHGELFFSGANPATGKQDVYLLLAGTTDAIQGPIGYKRVFTCDEAVTAVAGNAERIYIAVSDALIEIAPWMKDPLSTRRLGGTIQSLAFANDVLYYATYSTVGMLTDTGTLELLRTNDTRLAVRGDSLYIGFTQSLGVLALDHIGNLAKYDLGLAAVPTAVTPTVKLAGVLCFDGGEQAPPMDARQYATNFTREKGRYVYLQAELTNLRADRTHNEKVRFVLSRDNGGLYYDANVDLKFEKDVPGMYGWARVGTAEYPLYPATYTLTTYLNGAKVDTRSITVSGSVTAAEAVGNFDPKRLEEALKRGDDANGRIDGAPLLVYAAGGYNWAGSTPDERRERITNILRLLLKHRADIRACDADGETALHRAASAPTVSADVITLLLKAGADVNARDHDGDTPLQKTLLLDQVTKAQALLVKGCTLDIANNDGDTPLFDAVRFGHPAIAALLLAKGADPNRANRDGETPLYAATMNPAMLEIMMQAGVNVNTTLTLRGKPCSIIGQAVNYGAFSIGDTAAYRRAITAMSARGAELLPDEARGIFFAGRYRLLDQAALERVLTRNPELLAETDGLDDPTVQRAAIRVLLAQCRQLVANATGVWQYQAALKACQDARSRVTRYLRPESAWPADVFYNCALFEAHLGAYGAARADFGQYLALAPNAKDAKAIRTQIQQCAQAEQAQRMPVQPTELSGIWYPDAPVIDREKFFRVEFAMRDGRLMGRVLAQAGWEANYPTSPWVPVSIDGNQLTCDNAIFYTSAGDDNNPYTCSVTLQRITPTRLIGEIRFRGKKLENGTMVPNAGTATQEWRQHR